MTDRELLQMALEALESKCVHDRFYAIKTLSDRLAQPEPEPVAWFIQYSDRHEFVWGKKPEFLSATFLGATVLSAEPLYTAPSKREWVGLTDDDFTKFKSDEFVVFAKDIEAILKERNT